MVFSDRRSFRDAQGSFMATPHVGIDATLVAPSPLSRLTQSLPHVRSQVPVGWSRIIHYAGQLLLGLPASMWLLIDLVTLAYALYVAYQLVPPQDTVTTPHITLGPAMGIFCCLLSVTSLVFGLHERETLQSRARIITRMTLTTLGVTILAYAVIYVLLYATISRRTVGIAVSSLFITGTCVRMAAWWTLRNVQRGLLVVGSRALHLSFEKALETHSLHGYSLIGYASVNGPADGDTDHPRYLGSIGEQISRLRERGVTDIVVADHAGRDPMIMDWIVPCLRGGCRVANEAVFYEKATGQILVDEITPQWFLFADLKVHCDQYAASKRVFDVVVAIVALLITAPLWPIIALAVKLCDGGPVLYSQDRVGQNGEVFRFYKFRTMRVDAENGKSIWASLHDPRVTSVGRWLRRSRMDELPQLYNVLRGQMSIVGPRPERPDIVRDLCDKVPYYAERHLVKPGITGWAQISFRYGASIEDAKRKLQFDLFYLKHMSFELDMTILLRTVGTFVRGAC